MAAPNPGQGFTSFGVDLLCLSEFYYIAELGEKLKCLIPSRNLSGGATGKPTGVGGAEIAMLLGVGHFRFGCSQLIMKVAARVLDSTHAKSVFPSRMLV